jgi:uncharacterized protein (DUF433 family)
MDVGHLRQFVQQEQKMKTITRIVSNPDILGGTPVVEGTRVPVANVLATIHAGASKLDVFRHYPSLPLDGIDACLAWERAGHLACA